MSDDDDTVDDVPVALVSTEPRCETCGLSADEIAERRRAKDRAVRDGLHLKNDLALMIPMQPGPDGKEWHLCSGCWVPGKVERPIGEQTAPVVHEKTVKVTRPRAPRKKPAAAH